MLANTFLMFVLLVPVRCVGAVRDEGDLMLELELDAPGNCPSGICIVEDDAVIANYDLHNGVVPCPTDTQCWPPSSQLSGWFEFSSSKRLPSPRAAPFVINKDVVGLCAEPCSRHDSCRGFHITKVRSQEGEVYAKCYFVGKEGLSFMKPASGSPSVATYVKQIVPEDEHAKAQQALQDQRAREIAEKQAELDREEKGRLMALRAQVILDIRGFTEYHTMCRKDQTEPECEPQNCFEENVVMLGKQAVLQDQPSLNTQLPVEAQFTSAGNPIKTQKQCAEAYNQIYKQAIAPEECVQCPKDIIGQDGSGADTDCWITSRKGGRCCFLGSPPGGTRLDQRYFLPACSFKPL